MNLRSVNWRRGDEGGEGMSISNYGAIFGCLLGQRLSVSSRVRCQGGSIKFYLVLSFKPSSQLREVFVCLIFFSATEMLNVNNFSHCHDTWGDDLDVTKARLYNGCNQVWYFE